MKIISPLGALALLAACSDATPDEAAPADQSGNAGSAITDPASPAPNAAAPAAPPAETERSPLIGEAIAVAEWRKAENRDSCAPLALASDGGAAGTPRRANFSGGWAVAFDQRGLRSAYGFAGTGLLPEDRADFAVKVDRLAKQWPYMHRWDGGEGLPAGAATGYGLEGAAPYPADNLSGRGEHSIAYVRIPGQPCQYNVWSRLSRDHIETLLRSLRMVEP